MPSPLQNNTENDACTGSSACQLYSLLIFIHLLIDSFIHFDWIPIFWIHCVRWVFGVITISTQSVWGTNKIRWSVTNIVVAFLWAPAEKYHRLNVLNTQIYFLTSGGLKSEFKVLEELVSSESLSVCLVNDPLLRMSVHDLPSVHICVLVSSSYKDTSHIGVKPTLMV